LGLNLTQKIISKHLISGSMEPGKEIEISVDSTLTQDSTGTMVYLQLEAMDVEKVKTKLSVAYVDHNMLQTGFENADDHLYIKTVAGKYGIHFSRPGNGICHQVQLERFAKPGWTLVGSDSHTPTAGGIGSLAIGAGGLDVAIAMATATYSMTMPKVCNVILKGKLKHPATAKDVILYILGKLTVKGGVGKVFEYTGEGVKHLSVPERATITNMGAELGATTSIFPSDDNTLEYLKLQGREEDFVELGPDEDAKYDEVITVDLSKITPMVACPHSPDNVKPINELEGTKITQVAIGSCTNSSYKDLVTVARILKGKKVHPDVSLVVSPGSKQVLTKLAMTGELKDLIASGARILESGCGPCIGMGQAPESDGVSLRTFNRNFEGRSGTKSAKVYLVSPETAAVSALYGKITDPSILESHIFEPVEEIGELARARGVLFHIDAVQAIGKVAVDVEALRADALTGSGHKIYGPKGTGFLYLRKRVKLAPLVWGGGQERAFRPGTENVAGIAGLGLAAELAGQELKTEMPRLAALRNRLINGILEKVEGTALNGPTVKRVPTNANLRFDGVEGEALLQAMDLKGICVSSGSACSAGSVNPSHVLTAMGLTREEALSSVRMTLGRENTEEQIDYVLEELPQIVERLRRKAE